MIKKRKRIFYVPGLISLIFIPLLFLLHFYQTDYLHDIKGLDVNFRNNESFITNKVKDLRKYKVFAFERSIKYNNDSLNKLRFSLKKLRRDNDTINGIRVHFGKKMDYEVFVEVVDILYTENISTWMLYNDDIWIFERPKREDVETIKEKAQKSCICYIDHSWGKRQREEEYRKLQDNYKNYWILFLGYFGIVLLNIFALVKFNKNKY
ncbi:hypothetical protein EV144_105359 [Flavobacterium sp. 270]|uniref:hypothetical protein n=1 Tax=Flavobacterium sp. 270 TaxID=2512114 RepID=UPI00106590D2|nr:hypothetical protein [Flavobacterium sp. 270]TDW47337.1 hypothetical protein EV144_105359 [Flavobacterium sp. 270]